MKLTSIVGTGSGRLGGSVFAVRNGQQVVRTYQPQVANPQSKSQVDQRAKLKLASQLSAALAQELYPYGREGMLSARNQFVRDLFNRGAVVMNEGEASINMASVRLTKSRVMMLYIADPIRDGNTVTISGTVLPDFIGKILGVRAVAVGKSGLNEPYVAASQVMNVTAAGVVSGTLSLGSSVPVQVYVYAYVPNSTEMIARYGSITMETVNAAELATSVAEVPSGFLYSITHSYAVA